MDRESEQILQSLLYPSSGRYIDTGGVSKVGYSNEYPTAGGWVDKKYPTVINFNPNNPYTTPLRDIYAHEQQHVLDNLRGYGYENWYKPFLSDQRLPGEAIKDSNSDFNKLFDNMTSVYKKYKDKYNLSNDFMGNGFVAELKRIESTLPPGMNIFDTDLGKEVSKDLPNFRLAYYDQSRPYKGTYMYSGDTEDKASNFRAVRPKEETKSLKKKAIETIKQYFGL